MEILLFGLIIAGTSFTAGAVWGARVFEKAYTKKREELRANYPE